MSSPISRVPVQVQTLASDSLGPSVEAGQDSFSIYSGPFLAENGAETSHEGPTSPFASSSHSLTAAPQHNQLPAGAPVTAIAATSEKKSRISLACHACRISKSRCDGSRPICASCVKRHTFCAYETAVKRRGPDKKPGSRIRETGPLVAPKRARTYTYKMFRSVEPDIDKRKITTEASSSTAPAPGIGRNPATTTPSSSNPPALLPLFDKVDQRNGQDRVSETGLPHNLPGPVAISVSPPHTLPTTVLSSLPSEDSSTYLYPSPAVHDGTYITAYNNAPSTRAPAGEHSLQMQLYNGHLYQDVKVQYTAQHLVAVRPASLAYPAPQHPAASIFAIDRQLQTSYDASGSAEYGVQSGHPVEDASIGREPSLRFSQDTWWDTVLFIYDPTSKRQAADAATAELQAFFQSSSSWLSFINVSLFFNMFYHPEQRAMMQPALVLGCLAFSAFVQGSEMEGGQPQRKKALRLRDLSQAAFEASYNAGWIDIPLAQASWIFALFEACSHPEATAARMASSISMMDNVIFALGLTSMDADNTRSPAFFTDTVPLMGRRDPEAFNSGVRPHPLSMAPSSPTRSIQYYMTTKPTPFDAHREVSHRTQSGSTSRHCPCAALAMRSDPDQARSTPLWMMAPKWERDAPYGVLRREEGRRLVWQSLSMISGDVTGRLPTGTPLLDLELVKPQNFALLYPGENLYPRYQAIDATYSGKESTWALYARAMHLWVTCTKYRDILSSPHDKADFAMKIWMETVAMEDALNEHNCDGEKATMYQAREYIFVVRMYISHQYRRFVPIPQSGVNFSHLDRGRAMQWLEHQNNTALQIRGIITSDPNSFSYRLLIRRPIMIWWQMAQIWRALILFEMDNTLTFAVDVVLNILPVLLFLQDIWPSAEHRQRASPIMESLRAACQKAGRTVPTSTFSPQSR